MNANDNDADFCLFKLFKDNKKTKYLMFVLKYEIHSKKYLSQIQVTCSSTDFG